MLKAGIIGLGVGEAHIVGYEAHPDCKVTALCDLAVEKLTMAREKYPDKFITDTADDILTNPEIDIVSIASFDNFHEEQILSAILHNKHIFVEKPLCLYDYEARKIRSALNEKPHLKMSSNLILRKTPRFIELREMIRQKRFGTLFNIEGDYNYGRLHKIMQGWRGEIPYYSVILGGGVHVIDLIQWLTNDKILEVAAFGNKIASVGTDFRHNDMVSSIVKFESGMIGKISANFGCVYPHFHRLAVYGTQATFMNELPAAKLYETRDPLIPPTEIETDYPGTHKGDLLRNFVDSILNDEQPEVNVEDVFRAMSVCFAIEKAVKTGKIERVEYI